MKDSNLPTQKECFEIMKKYHTPSHILGHSLSVAKLAVFLANRLNEKGIAVDIALVERACLLHDMVRICDFKEVDYSKFQETVTRKDKVAWDQIRTKYGEISHEEAAYEILKEKYPVLALTIKKHRYMAISEQGRPNTWEEKLVYYADMRVMEDKIVSLKERLLDGHKRNAFLRSPETQGKIDTAKVDLQIYKLEAEIFQQACLNPVIITKEFIDSHSEHA